MRKLPPVVVGAVALLVLTLVSAADALGANGGFTPVDPNSPGSRRILDSYWLISGFILFIFVLVEGLLVAFVVKYRRGKRARDADAPQIHGSSRLETMWTFGPCLVLAAIAAFVFVKLPGIKDVASASSSGARLDVTVTGKQFYWQFDYPNGAVAIDRLRVPQGIPVHLTVTAPDWDVIHSWWIPALGGKIDAIPGRKNRVGFIAEKTGVFTGRCAELCGIQHAAMLMSVQVLPAAEFQQWYAGRGRAELGESEWIGACSKCHGLAGQGLVGPQISSSPTLQDPARLASLLRNGKNQMPPVGRGWSDDQLGALNAYLKGRFGSGS